MRNCARAGDSSNSGIHVSMHVRTRALTEACTPRRPACQWGVRGDGPTHLGVVLAADEPTCPTVGPALPVRQHLLEPMATLVREFPCVLLGMRVVAAAAAAATTMCDLNGDWSVTAKKVVVVNGTESVEHIEFFQQPGNRSFSMRTTDWKAAISSGTVSSATTVDINMVGGNTQRWYIESPECSQLTETSGGPSVWCRFPHCPFPEPKSWPPWSPGVPTPPPPPAPPPSPPPPPPEVRERELLFSWDSHV
jgi:hypothetical protein